MKKLTKLLLGLATVWPFAYMIFFFLVAFLSVFFDPGDGDEMRWSIFLLLPLHFLTMFWIMCLTIFYIVNIFRNERVDKDKKILWTIVLFMGSMIAMPIYWYLYIWSEPSNTVRPAPGLGSADSFSWANEARSSKRQEEYVPPREPPDWR